MADAPIRSLHDSHAFVYIQSIQAADGVTVTPLYRCVRCRNHTIQNVGDPVWRAHPCVYYCDECVDGVQYENAECLAWHHYVKHTGNSKASNGPGTSIETQMATPVKTPVRDTVPLPGSNFKHLSTASKLVTEMLRESGVDGSLPYLTCNPNTLSVKKAENAGSIPPATFLAVAHALLTVYDEYRKRNDLPINNIGGDDVHLIALVPSVFPLNAQILASVTTIDSLRDRMVKLVGLYRSTPIFQGSRLLRFATSVLDRLLPTATVQTKSPGPRKRSYDAVLSDDTIAGNGDSPARTPDSISIDRSDESPVTPPSSKRAKLDPSGNRSFALATPGNT